MRFRVIEDLDRSEAERFIVQSSLHGHVWADRERFADQVSAEVHMEKLAAPRVVAEMEGGE